MVLEDLRDEGVRARLRKIWTEPLTLDPAKETARVTRDIAERLAQISKALETQGGKPEAVAMFLMRCLFTMFAESILLLPAGGFSKILEDCEAEPTIFPELVGQLWKAMDKGEFAFALKAKVRQFNGAFFKNPTVIALGREEIGELRQAAKKDWKDVDPSIFGTLLEQALDVTERKNLGAHYTPRAYVERLVVATIISPLRDEWALVQATAQRQHAEGRGPAALASVKGFHAKLCDLKILDPACGTGNFLYVTLELMKRLEGEILEALTALGEQDALSQLQGHNVDPHQFLGLEVNPRAAGIAELVLWIGYLQWFKRTQAGEPAQPILRAFKNIVVMDAVRDRPKWPEADYIVGNPPFIGGKDLRARLGDEYVKALWAAHPAVNESADFVMYWWDHAASLLVGKNARLKRFGLVTTNSITQVFQRRVVAAHLDAKSPVSLTMAIADHPWTKATRDAAAVRIAMTVVEARRAEGDLWTVESEAGLDTDTPKIVFSLQHGLVNADLTVGVDVTRAKALRANDGLCSPGVKLHGDGFIVTPEDAKNLGLGRRSGLERHIREYRNGRDLMGRSRNVMVIDLDGLGDADVRRRFPEVYQHLLLTVKPERDQNNEEYRRINWWLFGRRNTIMRGFVSGIERYIVTSETAKHRVFQFLDKAILPDNKLIAIGTEKAFHLGVLSSSIHESWATRAGGLLEDRPVYVKTTCFDPFPFPLSSGLQKIKISEIAEELDAHRKRVLTEHPHLTLTGLYNVRALLRAGQKPENFGFDDRNVFDDGLVLILHELHEKLDAAVADAYGWPAKLGEAEILARLVALNAQRAAEEARGIVQWLRPDYQIPKFGAPAEKLDLRGGKAAAVIVPEAEKRPFPKDDFSQTDAVVAALHRGGRLDAAGLASRFTQGRKVLPQIDAVLASLVARGEVARLASGGFVLQR